LCFAAGESPRGAASIIPENDVAPHMTTKLDGPLKRELQIGDAAYTLTLSPQGFTLALKGKRKGLDVVWADLVSGDAALATALNASLTANLEPAAATPAARDRPARRIRKT
jgi:hypothetical protein